MSASRYLTAERLELQAAARRFAMEEVLPVADELDPERFAQVHRSVIVNLHQVAQVNRGANETAEIQLKGRKELLPVSRSFVHVFRQM